MILRNVVRKNSYYDSATLMLLTSKIGENIGSTHNVAVMMATDLNKDLMQLSGLLNKDGKEAGSNDLIFAIKGETEEEIDKALQIADEALNSRASHIEDKENKTAKTVEQAIEKYPNSSLAVVSLPGQFAFREVKKLLLEDKHVLLFSDNVSIDEENELKDLAIEKRLLMMGPDCGTAIINGVGLGFSNKVKPGSIGLVAASGTGLQEVARLISNGGGGISQAFGTGGRDVKEAVGGKMMLSSLAILESDSKTDVVVIVSKPPDSPVLVKVMDYVDQMTKQVVLCFLGGDPSLLANSKSAVATTLEEAAYMAIEISKGNKAEKLVFDMESIDEFAADKRKVLDSKQRYIRGLYCGGTLAYEAILTIRDKTKSVYSNIGLSKEEKLVNSALSKEHTVLDLGDDEFTVGKPHPMIEPSLRGDRLLQEALDPEVAVVLVDVELGYGSHKDPASVLAKEVANARDLLKKENREVVFVATICGTYEDFQGYESQKRILESQNIIVMESNAQATLLAMAIASVK
jgi:FdrA protein